MLGYASSSMEKLDLTNYGFEYDNETKCYYPIIVTKSTTKNITSETEEKVIAAPKKDQSLQQNKGATCTLRKEFEVSNYLNNKAVGNLINETGLTKSQILDWFSRKRRNNSSKKKCSPFQNFACIKIVSTFLSNSHLLSEIYSNYI